MPKSARRWLAEAGNQLGIMPGWRFLHVTHAGRRILKRVAKCVIIAAPFTSKYHDFDTPGRRRRRMAAVIKREKLMRGDGDDT